MFNFQEAQMFEVEDEKVRETRRSTFLIPVVENIAMAMNFFEHQDQARRRTGRLVTYFALAVLYRRRVVRDRHGAAELYPAVGPIRRRPGAGPARDRLLELEVFLGVVCLSGLITGGGSLYRIHQLSGGGVVAESLGETLLDPALPAATSGNCSMSSRRWPPPPARRAVYVIEDDSINAFAADSSRPTRSSV